MTARVEVELFGGPELLLGCRHVPGEPPSAGVLICTSAPFGGPVDEGRAARLAARLAAAGVATQRFFHRGLPPSDGDATVLAFDDLVDDARRALDLLRDRCGIDRVGVVGARLGALVGARVARSSPDAPMALWQPATGPQQVLEHQAAVRGARARSRGASHRGAHLGGGAPREAAATVGALLPDGSPAAPGAPGTPAPAVSSPMAGAVSPGPATDPPAGAVDDLVEVIDVVDVFDAPLGADLAGGALVGSLPDELGTRTGPLLVVQTAASDQLAEPYGRLVETCRARQMTVDAWCRPCDGDRGGHPVPSHPADALVDDTAAWLVAHLAGDELHGAPGEGTGR